MVKFKNRNIKIKENDNLDNNLFYTSTTVALIKYNKLYT